MAKIEPIGFDGQEIVIDRKRSSSLDDGPNPKRLNSSNGREEQVTILIPISIIGILIGKGGESMRALQSESKCRIDIQKDQECFQATNERTCTIKGQLSGVMFAMKSILEKIQQKILLHAPKDLFDLKELDRTHEMKLVVPHVSAGAVIGRSGSNIKDIRDSTNAQIRVSSADNPQRQTSERVITVGAKENHAILSAIQQILEKLSTDPGYARESEKLASSLRQNRFSTSSTRRNEGSSRSNGVFGGGSTHQNDNFSSGIPVMDRNAVDSFMSNLHTTLCGSGFSEISVHKTMDAMQELVRYNTMGIVINLSAKVMPQLQNEIPGYYQSPKEVQPAYHQQPRFVSDTTVISDFTRMTPARGRYDMPYEY
jgi:transcription antitermination factor NusA-like protein